MKVSCLCPTFNRPPRYLHLLNEAVDSFLRQVLPVGTEAEMVILNDAPGQILICDIPTVYVYNYPTRFASLGEKYNELVRLARGELLFPWEDDDISLPRRLAQAVAANRPYFNPGRSWYQERGRDPAPGGGYCHNASAFTRSAFEAVGGYPHKSGNQDAIIHAALVATVGVNPPILDPSDWQYVYRWGVHDVHLSGVRDGTVDDPHAGHYARIGHREIVPGTYRINPNTPATFRPAHA